MSCINLMAILERGDLQLTTDNAGFSFVESLFTVAILFILAGYIFPKFVDFERQKEDALYSVKEAEVMYNGMKLVRNYGKTNGQFVIDGVTYRWAYANKEICVDSMRNGEARSRCISPN